MKDYLKNLFKIYLISSPILLYIGERSYIAQDEGYYALQAKWILESGEWLAPMWWNQILYDRTIIIQWSIAFIQNIFGENIFASHIPSLLSALLCLTLTYRITKELIGERYARLSQFVLLTTYLWVNNAHLAGQDMPLLAFEMLALYSIIKYEKSSNTLYSFISGFSIGTALFIKSGMVIIPVISILPYILICNRKILKSKELYLGLIIGMLPLIFWIILSINKYDLQTVYGVIEKIKYLSTSEHYSKSIFYYLWNIPLNTFPWIIPSIYGMFKINNLQNNRSKSILIIYPILFFILLSLFKTKTSFYPLQVTPLIAISASLGIKEFIKSDWFYLEIIRKTLFLLSISLIIALIYININTTIQNVEYIIIYSTVLAIISLSWLLASLTFNKRYFLIFLFLGPYIAFTIFVQSGLLCNRDSETKAIFIQDNFIEIVKNKNQYLYFNSELSNEDFSRIVKIGLYSPNTITRVKNLSDVVKNKFIWLNTNDKDVDIDNLKIVLKSEKLMPWLLALSK